MQLTVELQGAAATLLRWKEQHLWAELDFIHKDTYKRLVDPIWKHLA